MSEKTIELIPLKDIIIDPARFQFRQKIDDSLVREYSELMLSEVTFPPVTVFKTAEGYILVGGFHRVEAQRVNGKRKIECEIIEGSVRDAVIYALQDNTKHGARLTNDDKRKSALFVLKDEEFSKLSDVKLAAMTGTTQPFISKVRKELDAEKIAKGEPVANTRAVQTSDGRTYEIGLEKIKNNTERKRAPKVVFPDEEEDGEDDVIDNFLDESAANLELYRPEKLKPGSKFLVGQHILYYSDDVIKLKKDLTASYDLVIYVNHIEYFVKHQKYLLGLSPNVLIFTTQGKDIVKLQEINILMESGTLLSIESNPYFLAYYSEDEKRVMSDLSVSSTELYARELIKNLTRKGEHVLVVNSIFPVLCVYEAMERFCTNVYIDPEVMSRDLMEFAVRFPEQVIEQVR